MAVAAAATGGARADTASPFAVAFGRLVEPAPPPVAAAAIVTPAVAPIARDAAIDCLALAITYEAGHEPLAGQAAVAQVVLNRLRHPAFPKTVCDVVYQGAGHRTGCQFTFVCDGSLSRRRDPRVWRQALTIAAEALDGHRDPAIGDATHYHANYVSPYWAPAMVRVAAIGAHIFYRLPGRAPASGLVSTQPGTSAPTLPAAAAFAPWGLAVSPEPPPL